MAVTYLTYLLQHNFWESGALPDLDEDIHAWDCRSLLQLSICLGNNKPPTIRSMESNIWDTLFSLARAEKTLPEAISKLANQLEHMVPLLDDNDKTWFCVDHPILPTANSNNTGIAAAAGPSSTPATSVRHCSPSVSPCPSTGSVPLPSTSNRNLPCMSDHNDHVSPPGSCNDVVDTSKDKSSSNLAKNDPGPRRSTRKKNTTTKNEKYLLSVNNSVKTNLTLKQYLASLQLSNVWACFGNLVPPSGGHPTLITNESVDKSSYQTWPINHGFFHVPKTNFSTISVPKPFLHTFKFFKTDGVEHAIDIAFHDAVIQDHLSKWEDCLQSHYVDIGCGVLRPRLLCNGASTIQLVDHSEFTDVQYLLSTFANKHVLFVDPSPQQCVFNRESLNSILPLGAVVDIEDFASDSVNPTLCQGTLIDLYNCALDANRKIAQTTHLPLAIEQVKSLPLSSDSVVWSCTRGLFMCPLNGLFPYSQTTWSQICLKGAVTWMEPHDNGFGLMQTFASSNLPSPSLYTLSCTLLQHLLLFYYAAFVKDYFDTDDPVWDHLPDILTENSCSTFIAVCLSGVCLSIFDPVAYQHKDTVTELSASEKKKNLSRFAYAKMRIFNCDCYIYVRGLAYHMLMWLFHHYDIVDSSDGSTDKFLKLPDLLQTCGALIADVHRLHREALASGVVGPSFCDPDLFNATVSKTFSTHGQPNLIATSYHAHKTLDSNLRHIDSLNCHWNTRLKETAEVLTSFPQTAIDARFMYEGMYLYSPQLCVQTIVVQSTVQPQSTVE
ncbi:hypothetical protein BJ165DRAFT_1534979 [Panaeolus papilionaceus]|nr:hypothetical protein BJ165DRAFT_1534979 [Panaeolus papilionaceus]